MDAFSHMVTQLTHPVTHKTITKKEYTTFCKEYIFQKLQDKKFGESFCKKFDIFDWPLSILIDEKNAKTYIKNYYIT
jgi:hypothetical protein